MYVYIFIGNDPELPGVYVYVYVYVCVVCVCMLCVCVRACVYEYTRVRAYIQSLSCA